MPTRRSRTCSLAPPLQPAELTRLDTQSVLQLISQVDAQYQPALALFYLEDYSYDQIASVLEVPLGTVKSRLSRGLAQLKALVARKLAPRIAQQEKQT